MATNVDEELEVAYRKSGIKGVRAALRSKPSVKASINVLAVKHMVYLTGDTRAGEHLLAVKPPGRSQILPRWQLESGMAAAHQAYRQENRVPIADRQQRARFFAMQQPQQGAQGQPRRRQPKAKGRGRGRGRGRGAADDDDDDDD